MQKKQKDLKLNKKKIGKFYICDSLDNKNEEEDSIHSNFMCSIELFCFCAKS
mgnify:FL=1